MNWTKSRATGVLGNPTKVSYKGVAAAALIASDQQATPPHQGSAQPIGKQSPNRWILRWI